MSAWLTTVLTVSEILPSPEKVLAEMRSVPGYETLDFTWETQEPNRWVFHTPSAALAVMLPDEPLFSKMALKPSCQRAWHWPEAAFGVVRSKSQIAVAALPKKNTQDTVAFSAVVSPLELQHSGSSRCREDENFKWNPYKEIQNKLDTALLLTCLTSAVAQCTEATAVLWNHSALLFSPETFILQTRNMNRENLPHELWIEFRFVRNNDQTVSLGTWGLDRFGLDELEVSRSSRKLSWLWRWLYNLSHFLLRNGPVIQDGHTFGQNENEKFSVTRENSAEELDRSPKHEKVLRLHFESESPEE